MDARPLILLDVNGVLAADLECKKKPPYCRCHLGWRRVRVHWRAEPRVFVNPALGPALRKLARVTGAELAWASFWEHQANVWIGPALHLDVLPVAPVPRPPEDFDGDWGAWKATHVVPWTGDRPFAWFDDEPGVAGVAVRLAAQPHKVIAVAPEEGLTGEHIDKAAEWFSALPARA